MTGIYQNLLVEKTSEKATLHFGDIQRSNALRNTDFGCENINCLLKKKKQFQFLCPRSNIQIKIDIFVNCSWVDTRWQQYSIHLRTNSIQNNTIHLGRVGAVPRLCEYYPGICLTTEEKARENFSQGSRRVPVGTMKTEYTEQSVHNNKNT